MVALSARGLRQATDAFDVFEPLAVVVVNLCASLHNFVHVFQLQHAKGGVDFAHFAVDSWGHHGGFVNKPKVFQVVYTLFSFGIRTDDGSAFKGVEDLGGMKADTRKVTMAQHTAALVFHAKHMACVVNDAQVVVVGNFLNGGDVARVAIAVHRHDSGGLRGDSGLDLGGVQVQSVGLHVNKHRLVAVPVQRVGRGHKAVRGGDDFARHAQGLKCGN